MGREAALIRVVTKPCQHSSGLDFSQVMGAKLSAMRLLAHSVYGGHNAHADLGEEGALLGEYEIMVRYVIPRNPARPLLLAGLQIPE